MADDTPRRLVPPRRDLRKPRLTLPPGACDTHFHIYFPEDRFPLRPDRRYTPVDATLEDFRRTMSQLGLSRGVVVTGAANRDNEPTLAAIAEMQGAFKGVALVRADVEDAELKRLDAGGMTGFRVSTISVGGLSPAHIAPLAKRTADLGWHVEIHVHRTEEIIDLLPILKNLPIPYCLDHLAQLTPREPLGGKTFGAIRDLLARDERCYVNLYGFYHVSQVGPPGYEDVVPLLRALIEARPGGVLWGSNWPHSSFDVAPPDEADLLDVLLAAAPDPAHQRLILADNPARLYGWASAGSRSSGKGG
jgi:predicted TIM-barrel fold metal-dependent hydrolase